MRGLPDEAGLVRVRRVLGEQVLVQVLEQGQS